MRLMERIRRYGGNWLKAFLWIFAISVFGGLGVGFFGGNLGKAQGDRAPKEQPVNPIDNRKPEVALTVNGRTVTNKQFDEKLRLMAEQYHQQAGDPQMQLYMYGILDGQFVREEVLLAKAE